MAKQSYVLLESLKENPEVLDWINIGVTGVSGIYCIWNTVSNNLYIGSAANIYKRCNSHYNGMKKGKHPNPILNKAVAKYGIGVFRFKLLKIEPAETMFECEQYYLDMVQPEYNINPSATGRKGPMPETFFKTAGQKQRKPIKQYNLKGEFIADFKSVTEAYIAIGRTNRGGSISDCLKGNNYSAHGYRWTYADQTAPMREKKSTKGIARPQWIMDRVREAKLKPVVQYDKEMNYIREFPSIKEAAAFLGIVRTGLNDVLTGKRTYYKGHIWKYKNNSYGKK